MTKGFADAEAEDSGDSIQANQFQDSARRNVPVPIHVSLGATRPCIDATLEGKLGRASLLPWGSYRGIGVLIMVYIVSATSGGYRSINSQIIVPTPHHIRTLPQCSPQRQSQLSSHSLPLRLRRMSTTMISHPNALQSATLSSA